MTEIGETELLRPRIADLIERPGGNLNPLTVLVAPTMMGKTVALQQWAEESQRKGQEEDQRKGQEQDRWKGRTYFVNARQVPPGGSLFAALAELPSKQSGEKAFEASTVGPAEILRSWARQLTEPAVIVIDDYQAVTTPELDQQLVGLLASSEYLYLIASGRHFCLLDQPVVTAQIDTTIITGAELQFTASEVRGLQELFASEANLAGFEEVKRDAAWLFAPEKPSNFDLPFTPSATGIPHLGRARQSPSELSSELHVKISSGWDLRPPVGNIFFRSVVKRRLERQYLAACATCPGVSAKTLTQVFGGDGDEILRRLRRRGLTAPVENGPGGQWRCVPGAAQWITSCTSPPWSANQHRALLQENAAERAETDPILAIRLFLQLEDYTQVDALLPSVFAEVVNEEKDTAALLRAVPAEVAKDYPAIIALWLALDRADPAIPMSSLVRHAKLLVKHAEPLAHSLAEDANLSDAERTRAVVQSALVLSGFRTLGQTEAAAEYAEGLEAYLTENVSQHLGHEGSSLPMIYDELTITGLLTGNLELAVRAAIRTLELAEYGMNAELHYQALQQLALVEGLRLEPVAAEKYLNRAATLRESLQFQPRVSVSGQIAALLARGYQRGTCIKTTRGSGEEQRSLKPPSQTQPKQTRHNQARPKRARSGKTQGGKETENFHENRWDHFGGPGDHVERMELWPVAVLTESVYERSRRGNNSALIQMQRRLKSRSPDLAVAPLLFRSVVVRMADLAMFGGHYRVARQILDGLASITPTSELARARLALLEGDYVGCLEAVSRTQQTPGGLEIQTSALLVGSLALYLSDEEQEGAEWFEGTARRFTPLELGLRFASLPYEPLLGLARLIRSRGGLDVVEIVENLPECDRVNYREALSEREIEIIDILSSGRTLPKVAEELGLSPNTLKTHLRKIYSKLDVSNRQEAVWVASQLHLIGGADSDWGTNRGPAV